jgi:CCR4-NOT transcription complex subunit 4
LSCNVRFYFLPFVELLAVSISASPALSLALSSTDFPALTVETKTFSARSPVEGQLRPFDKSQGPESISKALAKAEKKAAAAERAAERQKLAQEKATAKAAERERIAQEKAAERERLRLEREKAAIDKAEKIKEDKEKLERLKAEKAELEREKIEKERATKEQAALFTAERERNAQAKKAAKLAKQVNASSGAGRPEVPKPPSTTSVEPVPMLSKMPKKYKPATKPIKIPQDEHTTDGGSAGFSADTLEMPFSPEPNTTNATDTGSNDSQSVSLGGGSPREPTPLEELLAQIDIQCPPMNVSQHPIFDVSKINPAAKMPLEYGPLVHALSALSVGGGSFANSMPSGSIDNAVSSFQQLLETLTQTISDLLRLLPRTTWDDSSSFDGVLRDMLKGDDFLDDGNEEGGSKEDEVAALTMALERRARWMEVQLSKLEELHRDINMAAVRAVLSFNDNGWDSHGCLPRVGNTLQRFDNLGLVKDGVDVRAMTADELEKKLVVAREAAVFAETEMKEMVENLQILRPEDEEEYY